MNAIEPHMPAETRLDGWRFSQERDYTRATKAFRVLCLHTCQPSLGFRASQWLLSESAMLNIEAFRELCRRAAIEADPTALQRIKDALRLMLRVEQIDLLAVEKNPGLKPN